MLQDGALIKQPSRPKRESSPHTMSRCSFVSDTLICRIGRYSVLHSLDVPNSVRGIVKGRIDRLLPFEQVRSDKQNQTMTSLFQSRTICLSLILWSYFGTWNVVFHHIHFKHVDYRDIGVYTDIESQSSHLIFLPQRAVDSQMCRSHWGGIYTDTTPRNDALEGRLSRSE